MRRRLWAAGLALAAAVALDSFAALGARQASGGAEPPAARVARIFARFDRVTSPGCAVGVAQGGTPVLTAAYGMANLEYGIRLTPDTIFEAGSVSKQFTAAAIVLLAQDGKLSLDDPVRKYVPELPDFGTPILIRHLLNHTSGLRSQWPLLTLAGRPPGQAVHTAAEILELMHRQKELNFAPGDEYLYNNTGFTLLGIIVQRVSGQSLPDFTAARLFRPIGMARTQWRDDFTRLVKGRATAYAQAGDGTFHQDMPFTNVIGNGGLLTTVGDLLKWNANLDEPRVGGPALVAQLQTRGRLNDGYENTYAEGLFVTTFGALREISHTGSTAGYRAFLARYPDQGLSVAVLCNVGNAGAPRLGHQVVEAWLGSARIGAPPIGGIALPVEDLRRRVGLYRNPLTDGVMRLVLDKDALKVGGPGGETLRPIAPGVFVATEGGDRFTFAEEGAGSPARVAVAGGVSKPQTWEAAAPFSPTPEELAEYAGRYYSDELDLTYTVVILDGRPVVWFRPATALPLVPAYADAFEFGGGRVMRFSRDAEGRIEGFRVFADRVRHLRFLRAK